jgi:hypothetical protein
MIKSGIIIPVLIMVPNIIYYLKIRNTSDVPSSNKSAPTLIKMIENIGRLGILITPLFYSLNLDNSFSIYFLVLSLLFLLLYYVAWLRYFMSGSNQIDLRKRLLIPLPLAVYPSLYLICSSYLLSSIPMLIFSLVFAIGHISVSYIES